MERTPITSCFHQGQEDLNKELFEYNHERHRRGANDTTIRRQHQARNLAAGEVKNATSTAAGTNRSSGAAHGDCLLRAACQYGAARRRDERKKTSRGGGENKVDAYDNGVGGGMSCN